MAKRRIPKCLWDFGLVYEAEILSRTARGGHPHARTGLEELTGNTQDISEWLEFEFFDLVWFWHSPHLGFSDTKADPDVYRRAVTKPNGFTYYKYLLVNVDDVIVVSHRAGDVMDLIYKFYRLKGKLSAPEIFLGPDIKKWDLPDGIYQMGAAAGQCLPINT